MLLLVLNYFSTQSLFLGFLFLCIVCLVVELLESTYPNSGVVVCTNVENRNNKNYNSPQTGMGVITHFAKQSLQPAIRDLFNAKSPKLFKKLQLENKIESAQVNA